MYEKRIEIRWRDMDAFGHVNNAVFLTYLEEVRDEWLDRALGDAGDAWDFVLVHVGIDYRRQLQQGDEEVVARCRLERVGRSSIHTREELLTVSGGLTAQAESVMVARDRASGRARAINKPERAALEGELEPDGG